MKIKVIPNDKVSFWGLLFFFSAQMLYIIIVLQLKADMFT